MVPCRLLSICLVFIFIWLIQSTPSEVFTVPSKNFIMIDPELEIGYQPSIWIKRMPPDLAYEQHLHFTENHCKDIQKQIKCDLDLKYGSGERDTYDIFGTDLPNDAPLFVFVHGGYWQDETVTKEIYWYIAKNLYDNKIKTIFLEYELCPIVTLPQMLNNTEEALKHILAYAKTKKSKGIYLAGHSAGGHLVASWFVNFIPSLSISDQNLFKSAFLLAGIYNLVPITKTTINYGLHLDEHSAKSVSPLLKQLPTTPSKFYVIVAENDCPGLTNEGPAMWKHLVDLKIQAEYIFIADVDHFDLIEKLFYKDYKLTELILKTVTVNSSN